MSEIDGNASEYARASIKLTCIFPGDETNSIATGFFQKRDGRTFLVSNWHVFSGKDCFTLKCLKDTGAFPIAFEFEAIHSIREMEGMGTHEFVTERITIDICADEFGSEPMWIQHPAGPQVDLAAIDVTERISDLGRIWYAGAKDIGLEMNLRPASELFIIGYPKGLDVQHGLPVWKRASVASEPGYQVDGRNQVLVDSATREGMSGSPVYQLVTLPTKKANGKIVDQFITKFIGIYSGRYGVRDEFEAQIGRVILRKELDEVLSTPASAYV